MINTRDLGLAIRDHIEGQKVTQFVNDDEEGDDFEIEFVDVSDPHNPIVHLDNGQRFKIHIIASS